MKNPLYCYRRISGIYYFRWVKYSSELVPIVDIRFSLKTRIPMEAKCRAMSAWLIAQHLIIGGNLNVADITAQIKATIFSDDGLSTPQVTHLKSAINSVIQSNGNGNYGGVSVGSVKVGDELAAYARRKLEDGQWTVKTGLENKSIFDTFIEVVGNKPVSLLTKSDIEQYANVVNYLPPNRKKKSEYRNLSSSDASHKNKVAGGVRLSPTQRKKYFTRISPIFNEFVEEGLLGFNYFHRYRGKIRGVQHKISTRNPFTIDDLRVMFESDGGIDLLASKLSRPSRAWGYLIALFTGARAEEVYSLSVENIRTDDGIIYFNIDGGVSSVKTEASIRKIPVHPTLIELGLSDYLDRAKHVQKHRGTPMLFAELKGYVNHGYRRAPTTWFNNRFLPKLGIKTDKKCFHSFRHTTIDNMKQSVLSMRSIGIPAILAVSLQQ